MLSLFSKQKRKHLHDSSFINRKQMPTAIFFLSYLLFKRRQAGEEIFRSVTEESHGSLDRGSGGHGRCGPPAPSEGFTWSS